MKMYSCSICKSSLAYSNVFICPCCGKQVCSSCAKMSGGVCTNCYESLSSTHHNNISTKHSFIN